MKKLIIILFILIVAMIAGMIYMGATDVTVKQTRIEREITPATMTDQESPQQENKDSITKALPSSIHSKTQ